VANVAAVLPPLGVPAVLAEDASHLCACSQTSAEITHISNLTPQSFSIVGTCSPSKMIQRGSESNANKVLAQEGNCSINLASQGHCAGVFIGAGVPSVLG
jgi:hypothetical protein